MTETDIMYLICQAQRMARQLYTDTHPTFRVVFSAAFNALLQEFVRNQRRIGAYDLPRIQFRDPDIVIGPTSFAHDEPVQPHRGFTADEWGRVMPKPTTTTFDPQKFPDVSNPHSE